MLDNVSGIIISAADLRAAPEVVRSWIMGDRTVVEDAPVVTEAPKAEFSMPKFIEAAKMFMGKHGPPAMLSLLREVGAERVSQCTVEQAKTITEGMESYE